MSAARFTAAVAVAGLAWLVPAQVSASPADCPSGALATVVDDDGVSHEACVDVLGASFAATPENLPQQSGEGSLPSTGAEGTLLVLAGALVVAGSVAQLASRRRS